MLLVGIDTLIYWKDLKSSTYTSGSSTSKNEKYANRTRAFRSYNVGEMVYLKPQPYKLAAFGIHTVLKLATKFYDPFQIIQKVESTTYKLLLWDGVHIDNVIHISRLKKHLGPNAVPTNGLPLVDPNEKIRLDPIPVLNTQAVPHHPHWVTQLLA